MGVAQKRDFYKLKQLTTLDIEFITKVAIEPTKTNLKKVNTGWIEMFQLVEKLKANFNTNGFKAPEIDQFIDELEHNFEEDFHSQIEEKAIEIIEALLSEDVDFYFNDNSNMNFAFFLCMQYMRTNAIQQNVINSFNNIKGLNIKDVNIESCWSVMRHIYATNMAWVLFADRSKFNIILLTNETEVPFITGDQPVINTYAAHTTENVIVENVEFYYPISPQTAIMISEKRKQLLIDKAQASYFNQLIVNSSHEQIYAHTENELKQYIP